MIFEEHCDPIDKCGKVKQMAKKQYFITGKNQGGMIARRNKNASLQSIIKRLIITAL